MAIQCCFLKIMKGVTNITVGSTPLIERKPRRILAKHMPGFCGSKKPEKRFPVIPLNGDALAMHDTHSILRTRIPVRSMEAYIIKRLLIVAGL